MATMAACHIEPVISQNYQINHPKHNGVLDGLFDSFGEETVLDDDDVRNYDDVEDDHVRCQCNIVQFILYVVRQLSHDQHEL